MRNWYCEKSTYIISAKSRTFLLFTVKFIINVMYNVRNVQYYCTEFFRKFSFGDALYDFPISNFRFILEDRWFRIRIVRAHILIVGDSHRFACEFPRAS